MRESKAVRKQKFSIVCFIAIYSIIVCIDRVGAVDYYYPPDLKLQPDDSFSGEERYMAAKFFVRGYLDPNFCQSTKSAAQNLKLHGTCSTDGRFLRSWAMVEGPNDKLQAMKLWLISQNVSIPDPPKEIWDLPQEPQNRFRFWYATWYEARDISEWEFNNFVHF